MGTADSAGVPDHRVRGVSRKLDMGPGHPPFRGKAAPDERRRWAGGGDEPRADPVAAGKGRHHAKAMRRSGGPVFLLNLPERHRIRRVAEGVNVPPGGGGRSSFGQRRPGVTEE